MRGVILFVLLSTMSVCGWENFAWSQNVADVQSDLIILLDVHYSHDGSKLIVGGDSLRIFDAENGQLINKKHSSSVLHEVELSPLHSEMFVTASDDGKIQFWYLRKPEPFEEVDTGLFLGGLCFSEDQQSIICCGQKYIGPMQLDGHLQVWDYQTQKLLHQIVQKDTRFSGVSVTPEGKIAFAQAAPFESKKQISTLKYINHETFELNHSVSFGPGFGLEMCFAKADNRIIITGGECIPVENNGCRPNGRLWFVDLKTNAVQLVAQNEYEYFRFVRLAPDEKHFLVGTARQTRDDMRKWYAPEIQYRKIENGEIVWVRQEEIGEVSGISISPSQEHVACSYDQKIVIYDIDTGNIVRTIDLTQRIKIAGGIR